MKFLLTGEKENGILFLQVGIFLLVKLRRCIMVANKGKYLFGICKIGEKGQIVIPKEAREVFDIKAGDSLVILGDSKKGIAIVKADVFTSVADGIMGKD